MGRYEDHIADLNDEAERERAEAEERQEQREREEEDAGIVRDEDGCDPSAPDYSEWGRNENGSSDDEPS